MPDPTLRDRIRRAVCEAEGFTWDSDMLEPDEYGYVADKVLTVRDEETTALRDALGAVTGQCRLLEADLAAARSTIDRMRSLCDRYQIWHEGGWAPSSAADVAREYRAALDQPQEPTL